METSTAPRKNRTGLVTTLALVLLAGAMVILAVGLLTSKSSKVNKELATNQIFTAGETDTLNQEILQHGPIIYPDLLKHQHGTVIIVQHIGDDLNTNWFAINARASGESANCTVSWKAANHNFVDPCSGTVYPADGSGLTRYVVNVENSKVRIDLRKTIS